MNYELQLQYSYRDGSLTNRRRVPSGDTFLLGERTVPETAQGQDKRPRESPTRQDP